MVWLNSQPPCPQIILYTQTASFPWSYEDHVHSGLTNLGNTCFLNSTIQAYFHTESFVDFLDGDEEHRKSCRLLFTCVTCQLYRTLNSMRQSVVFNPVALKTLLPNITNGLMKPGKQQDVHEFICHLHDHIEKELLLRHGKVFVDELDFCSQQTTAIGQIFGGWSVTKHQCTNCGYSSQRYEPLTYLFVECGEGSIQNAVSKYFGSFEIVENFKCDKGCEAASTNCKRYQEIFSFPKVLRIVLKRFKNDGSKIPDRVHVDMSVKVQNVVYTFVSGVIHIGNTSAGGHYKCITNCGDGNFTLFNDADVTENYAGMKSGEVEEGLYVAFYQLGRIQSTSTKRSVPFTPTRRSPFEKKLCKKSGYSPQKRFPKKLFGKPKIVFTPQEHLRADKEALAEPLSGHCCDQDSENNLSLVSAPIRIRRGKLSNPLHTSPTVTNRDSDKDSDSTVTAIVTPLKLTSVVKDIPYLSQTSSRKSYKDSEDTVSALVTPIRIRRCLLSDQSQDKSITESDSDQDSEDTLTAVVTPLKIKKYAVTGSMHISPSTSCGLSSDLPTSQETRLTASEKDSEDTVTAVITPLKLGGNIFSNFICTSPTTSPDEGVELNVSSPNPEEGLWFITDTCDGQEDNMAALTPPKIVPDSNNTDSQAKSPDEGIDLDPNNPNPDDGLWFFTDTDDVVNEELNNNGTELDQNDICQNGKATFKPVILTDGDVPESHLPHKIITDNKVEDLRRWLLMRNIPQGGTKPVLVAKVNACIAMGQDKILDPKLDSGKWHSKKQSMSHLSQAASGWREDEMFPEHGWDPFPSRDIPVNFNFTSLYYYLVESMPDCSDLNPILSDDDSAEEEEEEEEVLLINVGDSFDAIQDEAIRTSKKIRRGLQFLKSGHVKAVQDCIPDRYHLYKAHVKASMEKKAYWVKAAISQISGNVIKACCCCKASALGRCSHVSALLLYIVHHKSLNGFEAITCTSRACSWNRGSLNRNPSAAATRQYDSFKMDMKRRATFDPRPLKYIGPMSQDKINDLLAALSYKTVPCAFQPCLDMVYTDFDFSDEDILLLEELRNMLYEALIAIYVASRPSEDYKGSFHIKGTEGQSKSDTWKRLRRISATGSTCHAIVNFKTESAKKNFLRRHMWGIGQKPTKETKYGSKSESKAREEYKEREKAAGKKLNVEEMGIICHTEFIGLSCSHDGLVTCTDSGTKKVLEIKCPYSLRNHSPHDFDTALQNKKLSSFYLYRKQDGTISLKENSVYYDQLQAEMGLSDIKQCDFVVWSKKDMLIIPVAFDYDRWQEISFKLQTFHWEYMSIEYFAKKTPRNLNPFQHR